MQNGLSSALHYEVTKRLRNGPRCFGSAAEKRMFGWESSRSKRDLH
jgi:hypothetical protein